MRNGVPNTDNCLVHLKLLFWFFGRSVVFVHQLAKEGVFRKVRYASVRISDLGKLRFLLMKSQQEVS